VRAAATIVPRAVTAAVAAAVAEAVAAAVAEADADADAAVTEVAEAAAIGTDRGARFSRA